MLKAILIWCSIVLIILVLIFKVRYVVIVIHIHSVWNILTRAIVLVIIVDISLISGWTPVALRNSINVSAKEVTALGAYGAAGRSWSTRWARELLVIFLYGLIWILVLSIASHQRTDVTMTLSDRRRRATMDRVTLRRLIFWMIFIHLLLQYAYKTFYLISNTNELCQEKTDIQI